MPRIVRHVQPGRSPGKLQVPTEKRVEKIIVRMIDYGPDRFEEREVDSIDEVIQFFDQCEDRPGVTWIDIMGLHDVDLLQKLGTRFGLHELALEDVVNSGQRPKVEFSDEHAFLIMRQLHFVEELSVEQISLFFGKDWVLSLQEVPPDPFEPVRERIREGSGRIRKSGADYLAYALVDLLVDNLYPILERYGEWIEALESKALQEPGPEMLETIRRIKRDLLWMRRAAWPHREVVHGLERAEATLISKQTKTFLRDCYDHAVQIMDVVDTFRELASGLTDLYLSSLSNRMNEVMKVLTIMASIFIPLTFVAGIYGMNFNPEASPFNMPELNWILGYPAALLLMTAIAGGMYLFFKRRKWL